MYASLDLNCIYSFIKKGCYSQTKQNSRQQTETGEILTSQPMQFQFWSIVDNNFAVDFPPRLLSSLPV